MIISRLCAPIQLTTSSKIKKNLKLSLIQYTMKLISSFTICFLLVASTYSSPTAIPEEEATTLSGELIPTEQGSSSPSPSTTRKTPQIDVERPPPPPPITDIVQVPVNNYSAPQIATEYPTPPPRIDVLEVNLNQTTPPGTKYLGFSRDCINTNDCQFNNKQVKSTAYLNCINSVCVCDNNRFIADVSIWKLEWENESCKIAGGGPCGYDDSNNGNLTIGCQSGLECIQGRCRDPLKLSTTEMNHHCFETIDCSPGLLCKVTAFYFGESRTCVTPETPALKGFEDNNNEQPEGTSTSTPSTTTSTDSSSSSTAVSSEASSSSTSSSSSSSTTTTTESTTQKSQHASE